MLKTRRETSSARARRRPPGAVLLRGFEEALIGYVERCGMEPVVLYDRLKCIDILRREGLSTRAAEKAFEKRVLKSWKGDQTPAFAVLFTP